MSTNKDIFKIETNHVVPARGKILISEPFLFDKQFGRSVVLLIEHTEKASLGLVLNKPSSLSAADVFYDLDGGKDIPVYWGGPLGGDIIFFLHTIKSIPGAFPVGEGLYVNGDFNAVREYLCHNSSIEGNIRFFMGYSGWKGGQLEQEIKENTWIVSKENAATLMDEKASVDLWQKSLSKLGGKYAIWSRFPQIPILN